MPRIEADELNGVHYGDFVVFIETPAADPFRIPRHVMVGDYVVLPTPNAAPFERAYVVTRILRHGQEHYPGVELRDLETDRRGIMRQTNLNRVRPLRIYHPNPEHRPQPLVTGAIYQDVQSGVTFRAIQNNATTVRLEAIPAPPYGAPINQRAFSPTTGAPKLVLRWLPGHPMDIVLSRQGRELAPDGGQ